MTPTGALFILKDIAFDRKMYDSLDGSLLSWEGSDLRRELNTVELANLPDDLAAEITPRKITQVIAGGSITTEDKLWVPSATELFGKGHRYAACDGPDEEQLPIFKTEGDRVKDMDGETWWYWLRSPLVLVHHGLLRCALRRRRARHHRRGRGWRGLRLLNRIPDLKISRPGRGGQIHLRR